MDLNRVFQSLRQEQVLFIRQGNNIITEIDAAVRYVQLMLDQIPLESVLRNEGAWLIQGKGGAGKTLLHIHFYSHWEAQAGIYSI